MYLDLKRIALLSLNKRRDNVAHDEVALALEVEANTLEA